MLDSVRAARQVKSVDLQKRTVAWGHSQGGGAALLDRHHRPDLRARRQRHRGRRSLTRNRTPCAVRKGEGHTGREDHGLLRPLGLQRNLPRRPLRRLCATRSARARTANGGPLPIGTRSARLRRCRRTREGTVVLEEPRRRPTRQTARTEHPTRTHCRPAHDRPGSQRPPGRPEGPAALRLAALQVPGRASSTGHTRASTTSASSPTPAPPFSPTSSPGRKHVSPGHHRSPSASQSDARPRRMCSTTARSDGWQKSDDLANLLHGPRSSPATTTVWGQVLGIVSGYLRVAQGV